MCATMNLDMLSIYKESYDHAKGHPMVKQLKKENKKLRKEMAHLKTMLMVTQENMRVMLEMRPKNNKKSNKKSNKKTFVPLDDMVSIKPESNIVYDSETDVIFVEKETTPEVVVIDDDNDETDMYIDALVEATKETVDEEEGEETTEETPENVKMVIVEETEDLENHEVEETEEVEVEETEEVEEVEETEEVEAEALAPKHVRETEGLENHETEEVEVEDSEVEETEEVEVEEVEVEETEEVEVEEVEVEEVEETVGVPAAEEEEVFVVEINGKEYATDDEQNGKIYDFDESGEINMEVGEFVNGEVKFY